MKISTITKPSVIMLSLLLGACASQQNARYGEVETQAQLPPWVLTPSAANGLAASDCIVSSGDFGIDRNHAIAQARSSLAQSIEMKADVLEKTYQKSQNAAGISTTGTSFEQIARNVTSVTLSNTQVEQLAMVKIEDVSHVCALVTLPANQRDSLFDDIVSQSGRELDPTDQKSLYREFTTQKTTEQLETQLREYN
ncbi:hypothetical protein [Aliagarivorans marinus]|uniref:hypothetical protein n=1 Tax=Aliagarivorans marinus TaxID=561965 RepID=UPI000421BA88|nr:hypothetical protein [Aliagarivorans marinus]